MSERSYIFGNFSHTGMIRPENQDYFGFFSTVFGELFVVCDGVGGNKGGSVASRTAVEAIKQYFEETDMTDPVRVLGKSLQYADQVIMQKMDSNDNLYGMASTCVAFLLQQGTDPKGWVAHAGDSRLYRIRKKRVEQLTKDHSRVQEMVDHGILTPEQAKEHQDSHYITRNLGGTTPGVEPDVSPVEVCKGDRYILCSDGVSGLVSDDVLLNLSNKQKVPQEMAEALVQLANDLGGEDNSTTQIIDIKLGPKPSIVKSSADGGKKLPIPLIASIGGVLLLIIAALLIWKPFGNKDYDVVGEAEPLALPSVLNDSVYPEGKWKSYKLTLNGDSCSIVFSAELSGDEELELTLLQGDLQLVNSINLDSSNSADTLHFRINGDVYIKVGSLNLENSLTYDIATLVHADVPVAIDSEYIALGSTTTLNFSSDQIEITRKFTALADKEYLFKLTGNDLNEIRVYVDGALLSFDSDEATWESSTTEEIEIIISSLSVSSSTIMLEITEEENEVRPDERESDQRIPPAITETDVFDDRGFNQGGVHRNGTYYDDENFDRDGFDTNGFNSAGQHQLGGLYNDRGLDVAGYDQYGYDVHGNDPQGHNTAGFNAAGLHKDTGGRYNNEGFDSTGFDNEGFDENDFNVDGFDRDGTHRNGSNRDDEGYSVNGWNRDGWNRQNIHRETLTIYNPNRHDRDGNFQGDAESDE